MLYPFQVAIGSASCKRFCLLCNKPRIFPDIRKKTLLSLAIKAVLLLAKKEGKKGAVAYALKEGQYVWKECREKFGVTYRKKGTNKRLISIHVK